MGPAVRSREYRSPCPRKHERRGPAPWQTVFHDAPKSPNIITASIRGTAGRSATFLIASPDHPKARFANNSGGVAACCACARQRGQVLAARESPRAAKVPSLVQDRLRKASEESDSAP